MVVTVELVLKLLKQREIRSVINIFPYQKIKRFKSFNDDFRLFLGRAAIYKKFILKYGLDF